MDDFVKLPEVARRLDVSEKTARRMVKAGKLPAVFIGNAYRVSEEDLAKYLESVKVVPGKAPRRSPFEPSLLNGLEEERQKATARALRDYMRRRADEHSQEVRNPQSPLFRDATTATLWAASLQRELTDWLLWVYKHRSELLPPFSEGTNVEFWRAAFDAYLAPALLFTPIRKRAEERIAAMADAPDELAARRMRTAEKEAEAARRKLEAVREAG